MGCLILSSEDRLYRGQNPREKFQSYRDNGSPDSTNHEKIQLLAGHIYNIICFIDEQKWNEANAALNKDMVAQSCGIHIDSPFKVLESVDDAISYAQRRAMFASGSLKMTLPQVALAKKGTPEHQWKYPEELPQLAIRLFPIWLEEWIHAFQNLIAGPICDEVIKFEKSNCFKTTWSANEVDIYAIYKDLDWDKDMLLETENRYDERIAFASHREEGDQNCKKMFH